MFYIYFLHLYVCVWGRYMSIGAYEGQKRWSFGAWATGSCESLNMGTPRRAAHAFSHWAVSLALKTLHLNFFFLERACLLGALVVRQQITAVRFLLPRSHSDRQSWQQVPISTESPHWPQLGPLTIFPKLIYFHFYLCVSVSVCVSICHVCVDTLGDQRMALDFQELELQMVVSPLI